MKLVTFQFIKKQLEIFEENVCKACETKKFSVIEWISSIFPARSFIYCVYWGRIAKSSGIIEPYERISLLELFGECEMLWILGVLWNLLNLVQGWEGCDQENWFNLNSKEFNGGWILSRQPCILLMLLSSNNNTLTYNKRV